LADVASVPGGTTRGEAWAIDMAAAQTGDGEAYRRLLADVDAWLTAYYAPYLPAANVASTVRAALQAVHAKRHTYRIGRPFEPWLAEIARYKLAARLDMTARRTRSALGGQTLRVQVEDRQAQVRGALLKLASRLPRKATTLTSNHRAF
jgi:RNA polymerase sigma-70 factor (ECF subfamily)